MITAALRKMNINGAFIHDMNCVDMIFTKSGSALPTTWVRWTRGEKKPFKKTKLEHRARNVCSTDNGILIVGEKGRSTLVNNEGVHAFEIPEVENVIWSGVHQLPDRLVAYGNWGTLFECESGGQWNNVTNSEGLFEKHITAVCAHPSGGYLACGWGGTVRHVLNGQSTMIPTDSTESLHGIVCNAEGQIAVSGSNGSVLHGTLDGLNKLEVANENYFAIAAAPTTFADASKPYLSSKKGLYRLADKTLVPVACGENSIKNFWKMRSGPNALVAWSFHELMIGDEKGWERLV